jgi:hypothetical protein
VIYVPGFIQKKKIGVAQEQERCADAVKKSGDDEQPKDAEHGPMNIKPVTRPRMNPRKSVVLKQDPWLEPMKGNPTVSEIAADLPRYQNAKGDPKKEERRNIDRRKGAVLQLS